MNVDAIAIGHAPNEDEPVRKAVVAQAGPYRSEPAGPEQPSRTVQRRRLWGR